jgi:cardiolipin synthase
LARTVLLGRQVVADTAASTVEHPARDAYIIASEPVAYFSSWAAGLAHKRIAMNVKEAPGPVSSDGGTLDINALEAEAEQLSGEPLSPAVLSLNTDGREALAAVENVIDSANCRLDVLMYLWSSDSIGWRIARRLAARAAPHLPVRVLVDGGGNLIHGKSRADDAKEINETVCWLAGQPHVQVLRNRNPWFHFDHRKLIVADARLAWSGGRNFNEESFGSDHDLSYTVSGPLAAKMDALFEEYWQDQGGRPGLSMPMPDPPEFPDALARVVRTRPVDHALARTLYHVVAKAEHHVYVENPYFGDSYLLYLMARARRRGADVRAVLTIQSDSPLYNSSNRVTANRLLKAGVRVYLYPGMTHVKALAVDGLWAYTGTGNFDSLSLRRNRELGLSINAGPMVQEIEERLFLPDFKPEWELTEPLPVTPLDYILELIACSVA